MAFRRLPDGTLVEEQENGEFLPVETKTDWAALDRLTDDQIEEMARSDPDHPALDDAFWDGVDAWKRERSFEPIHDNDLQRLATLALGVLDDLHGRFPDRPSGSNRTRLLLLALCQGAAQHFLDGKNGIKDFDLWAFFKAGQDAPFPWRSRWSIDFGPSRFGFNPEDQGYVGRRIDVMGRSIETRSDDDPRLTVQRWLSSGRKSAHHLRKNPVIVIYPPRSRGEVIWPMSTSLVSYRRRLTDAAE